MSDPRPSYPSLRFTVSPVSVSRVSPAALATGAAPERSLCVAGPGARGSRPLDLPRGEGLDLLDWLGLGRPEFGAISARELAPRCRRRLWDVERNTHVTLRARTAELLAVAEAAGEGLVLFG
jgi:hypothetical protein